MIKGSHNTFSYYKPKQWYFRPFSFVAKCQSKFLAQQVEEGVRVFDLRVRMEEDGEWVIAHNAFVYVRGYDAIMDILKWLNLVITSEAIYVRVLHEVRNKKQAQYSEYVDFYIFCRTICSCFANIRFFGGQRTMDWRQDYVFPKENEIQYMEMHASVRWPKWFHWCPWLYAKLYNKANERLYGDKDIVVYQDFI